MLQLKLSSLVEKSVEQQKAIHKIKQLANGKRISTSLPLLLLAACGGGGGSSTPTPTPSTPTTPTPTPDFTQSPTGTFTAQDDNNRTLNEGSSSSALTVTGKGGNDTITTGSGADIINGAGGNDTITTGSGNDVIYSGIGVDTIDAGAGDDIIVLIGTTSASQYTDSAITNVSGTGVDLSTLISLAVLNDHSTSDVSSGESINGGEGNDTLIIYGDVDISAVTVQNFSTLLVNSMLTLSLDQLAQFSNITGDGSSQLIITGAEGDSIDISTYDFTNVGTITLWDGAEIIVSDIQSLSGVSSINGADTFLISLIDDGTSQNQVTLSELSGVFSSLDRIDVAASVTFIIDDPSQLNLLQGGRIQGDGTVIISDSLLNVENSLSGVLFDDDLTILSSDANQINILSLGGELFSDISEGDNQLPVINAGDAQALEGAETVEVTVTLNVEYYQDVTVDYVLPDQSTGQITFAAGETSQTFTFTWDDNTTEDSVENYRVSLLNPVNATMEKSYANILVWDDEGPPSVEITSELAADGSQSATITFTLLYAITREASVEYTDSFGNEGTLVFLPGETTQTLDIAWANDDLLNAYTWYQVDLTGHVNLDDVYYGNGYSFILTQEFIPEPDGSPDLPANTETPVVITVGEAFEGTSSAGSDADWVGVNLEAGVLYQFDFMGVDTGNGTLADPRGLSIFNSDGDYVTGDSRGRSGIGEDSRLTFMPEISGIYFVAAYGDEIGGTYSLLASVLPGEEPDGGIDYVNSHLTRGRITLDEEFVGYSHTQDYQDWITLSVQPGLIYTITVSGYASGGGTNDDPILYDVRAPLSDLISLEAINYHDSVDGPVTYELTTQGNAEVYLIVGGSTIDPVSRSVEQGSYTVHVTTTPFDTSEPDGSNDYEDATYTSAVVTLGEILNGNISSPADTDWIRVELTAGEHYIFSLSQSSSQEGNEYHPYLQLFDSNGGSISNTYGFGNSLDDIVQVSFSPTASGSYYVNVGGGNNSTGQYSILIEELDSAEPDGSDDYANNDTSTAVLTLGDDFSGRLGAETNGEGDWIAVQVTAGLTYQFTLEGAAAGTGTASHIYFRNSEMPDTANIYYLYDDNGYSYSSILTIMPDTTETIYLKVSGGLGTYNIVSTIINTMEPDGSNDYGSETLLQLNSGDTIDGTLAYTGDRDTFDLSLDDNKVYVIRFEPLNGSADLATPMAGFYTPYSGSNIIDEEGNSIPFAGSYYNASSALDLVVFSTSIYPDIPNTGNYRLIIEEYAATEPDGSADIGNSIGDALNISLGESISGQVSFLNDHDWTRVYLEAGHAYTINLEHDEGTSIYAELYDENGNEVYAPYTEIYITQSGYYSVDTYGWGIGNSYTLSVEDIDLSEPDLGTDFTPNTSTRGVLEIDQDVAGVISYNSDEDWFSMELESGTVYKITMTGSDTFHDTHVNAIYDDSGMWVQWSTTTGSSEIYFQPDETTTYYISAQSSHGGHGDYSIVLEEVESSEPDGSEDIPGNVSSTTTLDVGGRYEGSLAFEGDIDFFEVQLEFDQQYIIIVNSHGEAYAPEASFAIYDANGEIVNSFLDYQYVDTGLRIEEGRILGFYIPEEEGYTSNTFYIGVQSSSSQLVTLDYSIQLDVFSSNDTLGTSSSDTLIGSNSDDHLLGWEGNDTLNGNGGDDILDGGIHSDTLTGGAGSDTFVARPFSNNTSIDNADMVLDYTDGIDKIGLNGVSFEDLEIFEGEGEHTGDTIIRVWATGEYLMILDGIDPNSITETDFTTIEDEWWLA